MRKDLDPVQRQFVGIDLHRCRSVIGRMTEAGERLETVLIDNDPVGAGVGDRQNGRRSRRWCWRPPTAGTGPLTP
jgi:hypothetical protein